MSDPDWARHEELADALQAGEGGADELARSLGVAVEEAADLARALDALAAATDPDPPQAPLPVLVAGARIGDYEVLERVGRGAFGVVYRARDPVLDVEVALKVLTVPPGVEAEVQERFTQEARAVARLDHPHVVGVRAAGWDPSGPYLVMDLVPGESLQQRLDRDGPLPVATAVAITQRLAGAVGHAHDQGVLHRDIKPDNVLVTDDDMPKLTDFGLARDALARGGSKVSRAGYALGTPGYWPPEQARGDLEAIGPASDVYGLGATLYALLTGRPPYVGAHTLAILEAMARGAEIPPPSRLRDGVDATLDAICARCLERSPARRYPSAAALERAMGGWEPGLVAPRRPVALAVGLLAVLVVAGAASIPRDPEAAPVPRLSAARLSAPARDASSAAAAARFRRWSVARGRAPAARSGALLVHDAARARVLLFGGTARKKGSAELWSWSAGAWTLLGHTRASPRWSAAGVIDAQGRVVIFGGRDRSGWLDDVWTWDGEGWHEARLPAARQPVAVYDPRRAVAVVLVNRRVWEWDGEAWSPGPAPPVGGQQMVWSEPAGCVLLFGQDGRLWEYDGRAWRGASSPLPGGALRAAHVAGRGDVVLALVSRRGPSKASVTPWETWLYRDGAWHEVPTGPPATELIAGVAFDADGAVLLGGAKGRRAPGRTWVLR